MATTPFFAVEDARTEEEHDHFGHPMPLVSAALKGVLAVDGLDGARRLLPSIAYVSGLSQLNITNILMVGGGCLLDKYSMAEKVLCELAGKTVADGTTRRLDYDLHANLFQHRHFLISLHRECIALEKDDREDRAGTLSMEKQLTAFLGTYHFEPQPNQYSTGMYAKALYKSGLGYAYDDRTDWRRATPASGRRVTEASDGKSKLAAPAKLATGIDVRNCITRKLYTILLIHGDADISGQGYRNDSHYGLLGTTVHWLTLSDILSFEKATRDMNSLPSNVAAMEVDWIEEKIAEHVKAPSYMTLACALGHVLAAFESRLNVAESKVTSERLLEKKRTTGGPPEKKSKGEKKREKKLRLELKKKGENDKDKGGKPGTLTDLSKTGTPKIKRMAGGNPAGLPCRNFASGTCKGPCRFSHATADDALDDIDDDGAADDEADE